MKYKFLYIFFISHILYSQQFRNITNISDLNGVVGNNGVAVADYDNDGDLDIFIVSARSQDGEEYWSRLFENTNNGNLIPEGQEGIINYKESTSISALPNFLPHFDIMLSNFFSLDNNNHDSTNVATVSNKKKKMKDRFVSIYHQSRLLEGIV